MELNFSILHIGGSHEIRKIEVSDFGKTKYISDSLIRVCSKLREADNSIAKIKVEIPGSDQPYYWIGNATKQHMEAIAKSERESLIW